MLQTWMIFEITLRLKNHAISLEREKKLLLMIQIGQVAVAAACTIVLITATILASITQADHREDSN